MRKAKSINGKFEITRTDRAGNKYTYTANIATPATPIKSKEDLYKISAVLKGNFDDDNAPVKTSEKYYVLYKTALFLGLRISDCLSLKVEDVIKEDHYIFEKKTQKRHPIIIHDELKEILSKYIKRHKLLPNDYLFYANRKNGNKLKPIDKSQAYRKLKEVIENVCPNVRFSNHTLRKACFYQLYLKYGLETVQKTAGHTSSLTTATYIGLSDSELREKLLDFNPFE